MARTARDLVEDLRGLSQVISRAAQPQLILLTQQFPAQELSYGLSQNCHQTAFGLQDCHSSAPAARSSLQEVSTKLLRAAAYCVLLSCQNEEFIVHFDNFLSK